MLNMDDMKIMKVRDRYEMDDNRDHVVGVHHTRRANEEEKEITKE